jgi:hypothetical protein
MSEPTVAIRRLPLAGTVVAAIGVLVAVMAISPVARANVDPYGTDARFISLIKTNHCKEITYTAEGYLTNDSGRMISDSTWKNWDGDLGICSGKAVFAWEPANNRAMIDLKIYEEGTFVRSKSVPGDTNYCLRLTGTQWTEHSSSDGSGGSGSCTAD